MQSFTIFTLLCVFYIKAEGFSPRLLAGDTNLTISTTGNDFSRNSLSPSFIKDVTITVSQKKILDQFRKRVQSKLIGDEFKNEDIYLVRWLRTKEFNMDKAEEALMKDIQWRKEMKMDTIHDEDWSDYKKYKYYTHFVDREQKAVGYMHITKYDLRELVLGGKVQRTIRYVSKVFDEMSGIIRDKYYKTGNISQGVFIMNIQGYNLIQHGCGNCIPVILSAVRIYEEHFPGILDKFFIINAPTSVEPLIQSARSILSRVTNQALLVYGVNRAEWLPVIQRQIDNSQLPKEIGGNYILDEDYEYDY